jgi:hypothetical protein
MAAEHLTLMAMLLKVGVETPYPVAVSQLIMDKNDLSHFKTVPFLYSHCSNN